MEQKNKVVSELSLNLVLNGRKIQINIACINKNAKNEIEALLLKPHLDIKEILKAYIQKSQECAELEDKIQNLLNKMEQI